MISRLINRFLGFALLSMLTLSCGNRNVTEADDAPEALTLASNFASARFGDKAEIKSEGEVVLISGDKNNILLAGASRLVFRIDPALIRTGDINGDGNEDAIAIIEASKGDYFETPEILIFLRAEGKLELQAVIEADMKVIEIKESIITAEVLTRSRNSPLRDCHKCREVVKYRFVNGELSGI